MPSAQTVLGIASTTLLVRLADIRHRLAAVNFLLGCVGVTQVTRILLYQRGLKNGTIPEVAEKDAKDVADTAKGVVTDTEGAVKNAGLK